MAPYFAATNDVQERAEALYVWNGDVAAACWRTLAHVEVLLRNACHYTLEQWSAKEYGDVCWYRAAAGNLSDRARTDVATAIARATRNGRPEMPGRVVAELSMGFWRYLLASRYDPTLWRWCLHRAFPHMRGRRRDLESHVAGLHQLRNRIAHLEPLHRLPLLRLHGSMRVVASSVNPQARAWIDAHDSIPEVLARRPVIAPD